jgi:protoporphyrinogen oxidase
MQENEFPVIIFGAGPAGLTAAQALLERKTTPFIIEKGNKVGGAARTETYKGFRFDIGGHRYYTKLKEVEELWHKMLPKDFPSIARRSRIYYQDRFYNYPLEPFNTLQNLGLLESTLIFFSYLKARISPSPRIETFEDWIVHRFGRRLYETFFRRYTEKVWGISCQDLRADWAEQRIRGLSLHSVVTDFFRSSNSIKTLIKEFNYPLLGSGLMWERFQEEVEGQGGRIQFNTRILSLEARGDTIREVHVQKEKTTSSLTGNQFISTIPLRELLCRINPAPPLEVLEASRQLKHRAFIQVGLIIRRNPLFPEQWLYIHYPGVKVARIQNFRNWSPAMIPDPKKTSLGLEYFCDEGDEFWNKPDQELIELAKHELEKINLAEVAEVEDGVVFRQANAYPVYDPDYRQQIKMIRGYLSKYENLQTIGRNGIHQYNNMDHSMLVALRAVENIFGGKRDLWEPYDDHGYLEN